MPCLGFWILMEIKLNHVGSSLGHGGYLDRIRHALFEILEHHGD